MSIESLPDGAGLLELVGELQRGKRLYIYYRDAKGGCWYSNMIQTENGYVTEEEYIFGKKRRER